MNKAAYIGLAILLSGPVFAQSEQDAFVEANLLGIFYHELGHAIIDTESLPVFGQEEDAADVFSILLVDALYEDATAQSLAYDVADGFWGEALVRDQEQLDVAWWDVHGPDEQRFYNTVCLFYGADPAARQGFAEDMELPIERAEYCDVEFGQAYDSWAPVLEDLDRRQTGGKLRYDGQGSSLTHQVISQEISALNDEFTFAQDIAVTVKTCGEANAFYDPEQSAIVVCQEFETHLRDMADLL